MKRLTVTLAVAMAASAADVATALKSVATYEYGKDPSAVRQLEMSIARRAGTPEAAAIEKQILAAFKATKTQAGKDTLCRALAIIGTSASVPSLASMLQAADTAEMARYALEQIPGPQATKALRAAVDQAPPAVKVGIVSSLGRRKDTGAVVSIKPLLTSPETEVANAAAVALGQIGTADARNALLNAKPSAVVLDALLAIAETSPPSSALSTYRKLSGIDQPEAVRIAAIRGMARLDRAQSMPLLAAALKEDTDRIRAVAIRELAAIEGAALSKRMDGLSPRSQVQLISALVDTNKPDILPVLDRSLSNQDPTIRIAGLYGMAKLGSSKQIPALAQRAATTTGDEQAAARFALASIPGKEADAAILDAIASSDLKVKVELITAAGERGIHSAPEALLKTASDTNRSVRVASIRALRETAGSRHVGALVALLVKTEDENDRTEYERAVAAAIRRSKDASVSELTKAYDAATDTDLQSSLLSVMAAVGNDASLPAIRQALKSSEPDVQRAAINALAAWPTAAPAGDLLAIAQTAPSPSQQVLALRGFIKLVQIPGDRTPSETVKMLSAGMAAAKRADEKKAVIAAAQRVIAPESLALVKASAADPSVASEAKAAITVLERALSHSGK